jgi:hypothetical protein
MHMKRILQKMTRMPIMRGDIVAIRERIALAG